MADTNITVKYYPTVRETFDRISQPLWVRVAVGFAIATLLYVVVMEVSRVGHFGIVVTVFIPALIVGYLVFLAIAYYQSQHAVHVKILSNGVSIQYAEEKAPDTILWETIKGIEQSENGVFIFTTTTIVPVPDRAFHEEVGIFEFVEHLNTSAENAGADHVWFNHV